MELRDRVAVITGGSGGIGRALAKAFLDEGASAVVIADLDESAVNEAAEALGCDSSVCDVTDESQVAALVDKTIEQHGRIDLFCSNAGAGVAGLLTDAPND
ncbi:MAG: SDR family NAD(P)-dependent oxidoreductase, partial [Pseudomonadales bacterium]|nr:SDR family NAD(P)-dependent oxidoreductase [Pseudomonadales bacterium]